MLHKLTSESATWSVLALASLLLPVVPSTAWAQSVITDNCVGTRGLESCVTMFHNPNPNPHIIYVPAPISEQEIAEQLRRDKRWAERCRPTIKQDAFGVQRYVYAAPGCEFGKLN
jgi:hypothetical protein